MVTTGVAPRVSATRAARAFAPPPCPPQRATAKRAASSTVTTPGSRCLLFEQGSDEADGGAGGEEEHDAVALVPGLMEGFLGLAFVEARVGPDLGEVGGVAAAVRGGCYQPDHGLLPETTKALLSAARRCRLADAFHAGGLQERSLDLEAAVLEYLRGRDDPFEGNEGQHDGPARPDGAELHDLVEAAARAADEDGVWVGKVAQGFGGFTLD